MSRAPAPSIGKHLAVLNLFRERDGSVRITVASAQGAIAEYDRGKAETHEPPIRYVERLIVQAAEQLKETA